MGKYGINAPRGATAGSAQEVKDALKNVFPNEKQIVVKSQTLAGGRRLGTFKSGLNGGVHIVKAEEAEGLASKTLGQIQVTKQTGPEGKIVSKTGSGKTYTMGTDYSGEGKCGGIIP
jgi:succinyl-CoA synthetase beta subunit